MAYDEQIITRACVRVQQRKIKEVFMVSSAGQKSADAAKKRAAVSGGF